MTKLASRFIETGEVPVRIASLPDDSPVEKKFNPLELRDSHGRWERSGEKLWKSGEGELKDVKPEEAEAAKRVWYRNEFSITNDYLRKGIKPSQNDDSYYKTEDDDQYDKDIATLKGMMDRAPRFSKPAVLARGVATGSHEFGPVGSKVGKVFKDNGFMSATTAIDEAGVYSGSAIIKLHIPAGGKAFRSEPGFFVEGPGDYAAEREYTIAPGTRWRVDSDQPEADKHGYMHRTISITQLDAKEPGPKPQPHKVVVSYNKTSHSVHSSDGEYVGFIDKEPGKDTFRASGRGASQGDFKTVEDALEFIQSRVDATTDSKPQYQADDSGPAPGYEDELEREEREEAEYYKENEPP